MADLPARRTLADVVACLDALGPEAPGASRTIFAQRPWCPESLAVVLADTALRGRAPSMPTYAYLVEVDRAAEVLQVWSKRRSGTVPSPQEAADALIHFAAHEAHQPPVCAHHGCGRPEAACCSTCGRSVCVQHATGKMPGVRCVPCSRTSPAARTRPRKALATALRGTSGTWSLVLAAGVVCIVLGVLVQATPLWVGGICFAVIGACIWLGRLVLQLME